MEDFLDVCHEFYGEITARSMTHLELDLLDLEEALLELADQVELSTGSSDGHTGELPRLLAYHAHLLGEAGGVPRPGEAAEAPAPSNSPPEALSPQCPAEPSAGSQCTLQKFPEQFRIIWKQIGSRYSGSSVTGAVQKRPIVTDLRFRFYCCS